MIKGNKFIIRDIKRIKKRKAQVNLEKVFIVITSEAFVILRDNQDPEQLQQILINKQYLDFIKFSDILDIKFPNFDKFSDKYNDSTTGKPFKIICPVEEFIVYTVEESFRRTRDFLRNVTQKREDVT